MIEICGIAAVARNGVIGASNTIPWKISEDLRRFKTLTTGQVVIMGRKTYDSIGRALPGRTTFVVTRDPDWWAEGVRVFSGIDEALTEAIGLSPEVIYVAGGGEIYRAAWSALTGLEITEVEAEPKGDVVFPTIEPAEWDETARDMREGFTFVTYRRRDAAKSISLRSSPTLE